MHVQGGGRGRGPEADPPQGGREGQRGRESCAGHTALGKHAEPGGESSPALGLLSADFLRWHSSG